MTSPAVLHALVRLEPLRTPAVGAAFNFQPVIIIGAPRSGTNLLRDLLTAFPDAATWPCDEINLVWRHGNARWPDDDLPFERATERVRRYIRGAFARQARRTAARTIVEKTCANALRVEFVDRVVPEARFIHIVRDGRDAVASVLDRWRAPLEFRYTLRKARFVPPTDLPYYAVRFVANRCRRLGSRDRRVASWGPRFCDMAHWLATKPLTDVCAEQWRQCVVQAATALARLPAHRVATVQYESLVQAPQRELARLFEFAEIPYHPDRLATIVLGVSAGSVGRWRSSLEPGFAAQLGGVVDETLCPRVLRDSSRLAA
jgi:hypothetical protein